MTTPTQRAPACAPSSKCSRRRWPIGRTRCGSSSRSTRQTTLVELFVAPRELGRVIGRQGRTAAALRTLAATAGEKDGKSVTLEIRDGKADGDIADCGSADCGRQGSGRRSVRPIPQFCNLPIRQ